MTFKAVKNEPKHNEIYPEYTAYFGAVKRDLKTKDKLLLLVRNMAYDDFLSGMVFGIFESSINYPWQIHAEQPEDVPEKLSFNESRLEKGLTPRLLWVNEGEEISDESFNKKFEDEVMEDDIHRDVDETPGIRMARDVEGTDDEESETDKKIAELFRIAGDEEEDKKEE